VSLRSIIMQMAHQASLTCGHIPPCSSIIPSHEQPTVEQIQKMLKQHLRASLDEIHGQNEWEDTAYRADV
jgi:hypothetical protein